ncbi:MAG: UDP-N-acetylmuramate--L-alanine ligase [Spirochaetaceae bacterium]|jgi:UDP-N-acetylmuramate--alanine ligase|nr:UDP-N-acetylmuramate--L-alanine ligase [Spirochaetaceae bacterium]
MNLIADCIAHKKHIYLVGIKGTGVCAFAELLLSAGACISGSDVADTFYTDVILKELAVKYGEGFDAENVPRGAALVVHSAAWNAENNVELAEAKRRGVPTLTYTEALGMYSALFDSAGVAGVHGKTTTTAIAGALAAALGLKTKVLAGSAISSFGGRCSLNLGDKYFIAETCEYRRHFLSFKPRRILLTSVESDHQDYYPDYASIRDAFVEYVSLLPEGGRLIFCADDAGAREVAERAARNGELSFQYGFSAKGPWRIEYCAVKNEELRFKLEAFEREFSLVVPGRHNALNAAGALALLYEMYVSDRGELSVSEREEFAGKAAAALKEFRGGKRRAEIIGERRGVIFMDDYGHHPTAIKATLRALREFYPERRLIVSFMPHTYSRTAALLDSFAGSFEDAGLVILHKIYASPRETDRRGIDGRTLFEETRRRHPNVVYVENHEDVLKDAGLLPKSNSLFLTLGAGDNWKLGRSIYERYGDRE